MQFLLIAMFTILFAVIFTVSRIRQQIARGEYRYIKIIVVSVLVYAGVFFGALAIIRS